MVKNLLMALILTMALCLSNELNAQVRHVKGIKALEAGVGVTDLGVGFNGGYLMYLSSNWAGYSNITLDFGNAVGNRKAMGFLLDVGAGYSVASFGKSFFINAYAGPSLSYDIVSEGEVYNTGGGFNFGLFVSPEFEVFIADALSLGIKTPIRYLVTDNFGGIRIQGNVSLRYNF